MSECLAGYALTASRIRAEAHPCYPGARLGRVYHPTLSITHANLLSSPHSRSTSRRRQLAPKPCRQRGHRRFRREIESGRYNFSDRSGFAHLPTMRSSPTRRQLYGCVHRSSFRRFNTHLGRSRPMATMPAAIAGEASLPYACRRLRATAASAYHQECVTAIQYKAR